MKMKLILFALLFSFAAVFAQDKAKLQKADESGFIEVDKLPALISPLRPEYPKLAKLAGIQGTVYLKLLIDEKGEVEKARVEQGVKDMLDESALKAAKEAKFSPAMVNDNPVKVWVILPVSFRLEVKQDEPKIVSPGVKPPAGTEDEPNPNELVPVEKLPQMISSPKPYYPQLAQKAGIEGKVFVKVLVGKDGLPKKAIVVKSENDVLNQSALDAAMKSKFTPAINKGEKIAVWVILPFNFRLDGVEAETNNFDDITGAKNYYNGFVASFSNPDYENGTKTEKVEPSLTYGDESSLFKITQASKTKYCFITRKGKQVLTLTMDSISEIEKVVKTRVDKMFSTKKK